MFVERILEEYYEGRNLSNFNLNEVQQLGPCLENIAYMLGIADGEMERFSKTDSFEKIAYVFSLYSSARALAHKIGIIELEDQISSRWKKISKK